MVKKSFEGIHMLKETYFMAVVPKSSSLNKEKCEFNKAVLNKILCLVISAV